MVKERYKKSREFDESIADTKSLLDTHDIKSVDEVS